MVSLRRPRPGEAPGVNGGFIPALAWADVDHAQVVVRAPFERVLFGLARVAHEVEHLTRPDFQRNEDHHPWAHFCGRSPYALRSLRHLHPDSVALARELVGSVSTNPPR